MLSLLFGVTVEDIFTIIKHFNFSLKINVVHQQRIPDAEYYGKIKPKA